MTAKIFILGQPSNFWLDRNYTGKVHVVSHFGARCHATMHHGKHTTLSENRAALAEVCTRCIKDLGTTDYDIETRGESAS